MSHKQKIHAKNSTEAELIVVGEALPQTLWTIYFLVEQGYTVKKYILHHDNQSAKIMERNGIMATSNTLNI